jgi:putative ABC transport system substrate-binding protein
MQRRKFIMLLGGALSAWSRSALAQQPEQIRRIGVLSGIPAADPETKAGLAVFVGELGQRGWTEGRNLKIEYRFTASNGAEIRKADPERTSEPPSRASFCDQIHQASRLGGRT